MLSHRIRFCCPFLLLQVGLAQEVSFRITPLRPVQELRAEALKASPPHEQGSFREPGKQGFQFDLRHGSASYRALAGAPPNVKVFGEVDLAGHRALFRC